MGIACILFYKQDFFSATGSSQTAANFFQIRPPFVPFIRN